MKCFFSFLLFAGVISIQMDVRACIKAPKEPTISVLGGAQKSNEKDYYIVEIPEQGQTTVTIEGKGQTPCPTDAEKCKCEDKKQDSKEKGEPKFTFSHSVGNQKSANGAIIEWDVDSSTSPGEYKFTVIKIEQEYEDCPEGWTGGVELKSNTQTAEVTILAYKIETKTVATVPQNRKRRKLGIGETVTITFEPIDTAVNWVVDNSNDGGSVVPSSGTVVAYTTASVPASAKVYVLFKGIQKEIYFSNIAPSSVLLDLKEPKNLVTDQGLRISAHLNVYIGPVDVNFSNISITEWTCEGSAEGYFDSADGRKHEPEAILTVSEDLVAGKGWKLNGHDVASTFWCPPPYREGKFNWPIPYYYLHDLAGLLFATVDQGWQMSMTDSKGKLSAQKSLYSDSIIQP